MMGPLKDLNADKRRHSTLTDNTLNDQPDLEKPKKNEGDTEATGMAYVSKISRCEVMYGPEL